MLHARSSRTVNGVTFKFRGDQRIDRVTVTVLMSENRSQRRAWSQAMREHGWEPGETMAACWAACLEHLGLTATPCDECGMTMSYSVSGLVVCLEQLLSLPILRVEYREASVPRGGRPQDYVQVSGRGQDRMMSYIPCPHGLPRPKPGKVEDDKPTAPPPEVHYDDSSAGPWA